MKRQAALGKRTTRSKSKQTSLHDFECPSSSVSSSHRSSRSTATSKRAVEKLRRAAYSSLSADIPKRVKSADDTNKPARRQSGAATSIVAGSCGAPRDMTKTGSNAVSERDTTCVDETEAKQSPKRVKTASNNCVVEIINDTGGKGKRISDVAQDNDTINSDDDDDNESNQESVEVTPAAKITQLRQVTIEPKSFSDRRYQQQLQRHDSSQIVTPHFHNSWKKPYSHNSPLPPGVIDIDTFHHQCCSISLISHCGYSWVTSWRRCHCEIDANHNSIESITQSYLGTYGQERCVSRLDDEWKVEQWCLDRVGSERTVHVARMKKGLEKRWEITNLPPSIPTKVEFHLDYMIRQPHINIAMRAILMDWLVELAEEYKLTTETLFLSVMLVDRSLAMAYGVEGYRGSEMLVEKDQLQCVGCACTLIAAKLLEITPPGANEFVWISDNSYKRKDILEMEANIANSLGFNLQFITPYHHVHRFLAASQASSPCSLSADLAAMRLGKNNAINDTMEKLVMYFLELSILEYEFVAMKPSMLAAAAVYLARCTLGIREPSTAVMASALNDEFASPYFQRAAEGYWSKTLQHYTGYDMWALEKPVKLLHRLHEGAETNRLNSIFTKHKKAAHNFVALRNVAREEDLGFL